MIRSLTTNNTQVYHLSSGKSLPEFIKESATKNKSLKKDQDYRRRLELIQEFEFPVSTGKVCVSEDGNHIAAVGIYPPELRVFDTSQLSIKFSRGFDCEIVDFQFLSQDYRKLVFLHTDRTVEFHSQGGRHDKLRIPYVGRCLHYVKHTAELVIGGSSPDLLRIDLENGIFHTPIKTRCDAINCCISSPQLPIVFAGGTGGIVEVFDTRQWKSVNSLLVSKNNNNMGSFSESMSITALDISSNGMNVCVGTSQGICKIYDIRSSKPIAERDHRNQLPIVDIKIAKTSQLLNCNDAHLTIVSADKKAVKIWEVGRDDTDYNSENAQFLGHLTHSYGDKDKLKQTTLIASLDAEAREDISTTSKNKFPGAINNIAIYPNSGLIFVAQDNPRIGIYFIPKLGLAPKWCSFLDSLTEEMEESPEEIIYEDFQFVTKLELEDLGAGHLIGTPLLRAYMHGYFMDGRLYNKLKAVSQSEAFEELRKKRLQERIDSKRTMRLQIRRKLPPVNKDFASRLEEKAAINSKTGATAKSLLTDNRFAQLFTNPNFAIESIPINTVAAVDSKVEQILREPLKKLRKK